MCLYIDDDGDFTTLRYGWRAARKAHKCTECSREIHPGNLYFYQTAVDHWSNGIVTWKMCGHCRALISVGARLAGCPEAWYWESVLDISEEGFAGDILLHDLPPGSRIRFLRLVVLARRKWRGRDGALVGLPQVEEPAA